MKLTWNKTRLIILSFVLIVSLISTVVASIDIPRVKTTGNIISIGLRTTQAAGTVTNLGAISDKLGTSPWTALSSLSLSAGDYLIVGEGADSKATDVIAQLDGTVKDQNTTTAAANALIYGANYVSQSFTAGSAYTLKGVRLYLAKYGSPSGTLAISLYTADVNHKPSGSVLSSGSLPISYFVDTALRFFTIVMSDYSISNGTEYCIVLSGITGDASNRLSWRRSTSDVYASGTEAISSDSGASWTVEAYDCYFQTLSVLGADVILTADVTAGTGGGNAAVATIWRSVSPIPVTGTAYYIIIANTSVAKAISAYKVGGLVSSSALDKYPSASGTGVNARTGSTGFLTQNDEVCIAVTAVEDETDDAHGTWTSGAGYIYDASYIQFAATNDGGDTSNIQVHSVSKVVADGTSQAYQGNDDGHDSSDWAAVAATYKVDTGGTPIISVSPTTYDFGVVDVNSTTNTTTTYFSITNNSTMQTDQTIAVTTANWSGGYQWVHSNTATAGADTAGLNAQRGGTWGSAVVVVQSSVTGTPQYIYEDCPVSTNYTFGLSLVAPTSHSDGVEKQIIVRVSAAAG